jgi:hypothetical protein
VHEASPEVDAAKATPTLGGLVTVVTASSPSTEYDISDLVGVAALTAALVVGAAVPALAQDVTPWWRR